MYGFTNRRAAKLFLTDQSKKNLTNIDGSYWIYKLGIVAKP
jgi:hypothetical protein